MFKVKALYDFEAQPENGELKVTTGDILTVTNQDVGDGWWGGTNANGESGLFPEAFVEIYNGTETGNTQGHTNNDWNNPGVESAYENTTPNQPPQFNFSPSFEEDDIDSDMEPDSLAGTSPNDLGYKCKSELNPDKSRSLGRMSSMSTFNRFTTFVKSGGEDFILGAAKDETEGASIIQVLEDEAGRFTWVNSKPTYSCTLSSPKKGSKLKGIKTFTTYQITASFSGLQVSRRYKHFDWLHEQLMAKFTMLPVPVLPDKQAMGRYEDDFIEHRMKGLQNFIDRICSHPILSESEVWKHFITCTDKTEWKKGKRKAETDTFLGGSLFQTINAPEKPIDSDIIVNKSEAFCRFTESFNSGTKNVLKIATDQTQKCQNQYKKEYKTISQGFLQLGQSMEQNENDATTNLTKAITFTGESYEEISKLVDDQPKNDWMPLADMMYQYSGMLDVWTNILKVHSGALGKIKEADDVVREGKLTQTEAKEIKDRTDVISYALLAEINTFDNVLCKEIRDAHKDFLKAQITHHQKITEQLQSALSMYDNC